MGCMTLLHHFKLQRTGLILQFYGDASQCKRVHEKHIECLNHSFILDVCKRSLTVKEFLKIVLDTTKICAAFQLVR